MKTAKDPRHLKRKKTVRALFSRPFQAEATVKDSTAEMIWKDRRKIDAIIEVAAPEWAIEKINRTDLAILRLAIWELTIEKKTPPKVVVDEAVELAKRYGAEKSPGFVNGVLGTILKNLKAQNSNVKTTT